MIQTLTRCLVGKSQAAVYFDDTALLLRKRYQFGRDLLVSICIVKVSADYRGNFSGLTGEIPDKIVFVGNARGSVCFLEDILTGKDPLAAFRIQPGDEGVQVLGIGGGVAIGQARLCRLGRCEDGQKSGNDE